ncbi:MAG: hypothetical protein ACE5HC_03675 [Candidatus Binatia bacterium]
MALPEKTFSIATVQDLRGDTVTRNIGAKRRFGIGIHPHFTE